MEMNSDLLIGGAVVGGIVVILRAIEPLLVRSTKNGLRKTAGELDPADWENRLAFIIDHSLEKAIEGQNRILTDMAATQKELAGGLIKLTALFEINNSRRMT